MSVHANNGQARRDLDERSPIDWSAALEVHSSWLRKVIFCRVGDPHAVDDIMQEIALALVRRPPPDMNPRKVAPWLYGVAVRKAANYHRRRARRPPRTIDPDAVCANQASLDEPASVGDALNWLADKEQQRLVTAAINRMSPHDNQLLLLKYTEHWTYQQLADHLGVTTDCIEYRLLRAKRRLRQLLIAMGVSEVSR
jgi:RNA polymerase sigma-70 factor (ECF subfamily)